MIHTTTEALYHVTLQAFTPEQLLPYVHSVSSVQSFQHHDVLVHRQESHAIVMGYALNEHWSAQTNISQQVENTLRVLIAQEDVEQLTVLAAQRPSLAPPHALCHEDSYYFLPLPLSKKKASNALSMCSRALPHIYITQSQGAQARTGAHQELMLSYLQRADISKEMASIFQRLGTYCLMTPEVRLFSAHAKDSDRLLGMTLGDFSSLQTAFYMFAFRHAKAVPGVSEALLLALLQEAEQRGYTSCNLGLGIHDGIRFFKEKWGAQAALPLVESTWTITKNTHSKPHNATTWAWLRKFWS